MKKKIPIRSMTGFGKGSAKGSGCWCYVEVKSVNHRYLDINTKIPDELSSLELEIKKIVKLYLKRGAIYLTLNLIYDRGVDLEINNELFKKLLRLEKEVERKHGISQPLNIHYILSYPGVVREVHPKVAFKIKREVVYSAVKNALETLVKNREREGINLKRDIEFRLGKIEKNISIIAFFEEGREKHLLKVLQQQDQQPEDSKIATPWAIPSTAEEIVRLKSHLKSARALLNRGGVIGRELDFLAQEMHREVTTLSAKALSAKTSRYVVKIKAEIEKIREQSLNIE